MLLTGQLSVDYSPVAKRSIDISLPYFVRNAVDDQHDVDRHLRGVLVRSAKDLFVRVGALVEALLKFSGAPPLSLSLFRERLMHHAFSKEDTNI